MLRGRPEAVQPGQNPGRWSPSWDSTAQLECATLEGCRCSAGRRDPRYPQEDETGDFVSCRAEAGHFKFYFGWRGWRFPLGGRGNLDPWNTIESEIPPDIASYRLRKQLTRPPPRQANHSC